MIIFGELNMEEYFEIRNHATARGFNFELVYRHEGIGFTFKSTKKIEAYMWLKYGK